MSTPTPPEADPTPDRDERELAALYRQLPKAEPDDALDARVLGAAEDAIARKPRRGRWMIGLASAASLVMAAGLTWHFIGTGSGPAAGGHPAASTPAAPGANRSAARQQVVPVRILSEQQAAQRLKAQQGSSAADALAAPAPPPPPAMAAKAMAPANYAPSAAQELISQARQALKNEDEGRARYLMHQFVERYPGTKVPADLVPYAPDAKAPQ